MVLSTPAVGVTVVRKSSLRLIEEAAGEPNAAMPRVPGALHAIGGMPAFSFSVRHGTPFLFVCILSRGSTTEHPPQDKQRIIRDGLAADRTDFELPGHSVLSDIGSQPAATARTALCHAPVVRHDRLRRKDVDCLLARRTRNAVPGGMTHGRTFPDAVCRKAPEPQTPRGLLDGPSIVRGNCTKVLGGL